MKDEARNLTPTAAFFIGCGLAEQLAARFSVPTTSLRVSVRTPARLCLHVCVTVPCLRYMEATLRWGRSREAWGRCLGVPQCWLRFRF